MWGCINHQNMNDSGGSIREDLMRIRNSQAELLEELRNQHRLLEGSYSYRTSALSQHGSLAAKTKKAIQTIGQEKEYNDEEKEYNDEDREYNELLNCESSLDFSRSEGAYPQVHKNKMGSYGSTSAETILENNYKKIEELLIRQRSMQEENHALQQQNESLLDDYRQIKKLYYQRKQADKLNEELLHFVFAEVLHDIVRGLLLNETNERILSASRKKLNRFKMSHLTSFPSLHQIKRERPSPHSVKRESSPHQVKKQGEESCGMGDQIERLLESIFGLLEQDYKVVKTQNSEEDRTIKELRTKVQQLISQKQEQKRNEEMRDLKQEKGMMVKTLQDQIWSLGNKVRSLERASCQKQQQWVRKSKVLEDEIVNMRGKVRIVSQLCGEKERKLEQAEGEVRKLKSLKEGLELRQQEAIRNLQNQSLLLKKKQALYASQLELARQQNATILKLSRDIVSLIKQRDDVTAENSRLLRANQAAEQKTKSELEKATSQFEMLRQQSQKQLGSLHQHLSQIKSQYEESLKCEEIARKNEIKYREMVGQRSVAAKLTANVSHLWAVKEVEYANVVGLLQYFR